MARRGSRLYECDECHERRYVAKIELDRAARPRCDKCGSTRLELVTEAGKNDMLNMQRQRVTGAGGSLILSTQADKPRRRVT